MQDIWNPWHGCVKCSEGRENCYMYYLDGMRDKDGKKYILKGKRLQTNQALKSGMNYQGRPMQFELTDSWGLPVPEEELYVKHYCGNCRECAMKLICNGCSDCGKCKTER